MKQIRGHNPTHTSLAKSGARAGGCVSPKKRMLFFPLIFNFLTLQFHRKTENTHKSRENSVPMSPLFNNCLRFANLFSPPFSPLSLSCCITYKYFSAGRCFLINPLTAGCLSLIHRRSSCSPRPGEGTLSHPRHQNSGILLHTSHLALGLYLLFGPEVIKHVLNLQLPVFLQRVEGLQRHLE